MKMFNIWKKKSGKKIDKKKCNRVFQKNTYGKSPEEWPYEMKIAQAAPHLEAMLDSVNVMKNTACPQAYFAAYQTALQEAREVVGMCKKHEIGKIAMLTVSGLLSERVRMTNAFIDRCTSAGNISSVKLQLSEYREKMPAESCEYLESLLGYCA